MTTFLMIMLLLTALFLIMLILVQRGRGGGLAGAFGGMGGQSAFGTKAGDLFTRVTIGVAIFWILLCIVTIKFMGISESRLDEGLGASAQTSGGQIVSPEVEGQQDQSDTSGSSDSGSDSSLGGASGAASGGSGDAEAESSTGGDDGS